ncbi:MAG: uroporphyrinogen decarboxylase family protein [bacterium JZ-2024 1]
MKQAERIESAIAGRPVDRIPWALWRHFPGADATAEGLASAVVAFQQRHQFDFVKVTPANALFAEAWGTEMLPSDNPEGTRAYGKRAVLHPNDWAHLRPLSCDHPLLAREIRAISLIRSALGDDIPIFQTLFSPVSIAKNLVGEEALVHHLRDAPDQLHRALQVINESTLAFAIACSSSGADSLFFAVNTACPPFFTADEYTRFALPLDRALITELRPRARWILLHLHGTHAFFPLFRDFPADIVNWHDRRSALSLREGKDLFAGAVLGGLNEWHTLLPGPPDAIRAEVHDAIALTGGRRFILGAGCVIPITTSDAHLDCARDALANPPP